MPATSQQTCQRCAFLLTSDDQVNGLRCGLHYYSQPASQRRQMPLRSYPRVSVRHCCESWQDKSTSLLDSLLKNSQDNKHLRDA